MTAHTEISAELPCHRCGYDLRAHPQSGICPECGASVAEASRFAAIPLRPLWRDSDPRWRRRMLAGAWILVLMPLIDVLMNFGWASNISIPIFFNSWTGLTLDETLLTWPRVYQSLIFCIGMVLLFSKERKRRRNRLDWTGWWGVICCYVSLLLSAVQVLFISALVLTGISAVFISMPLKYQPHVTSFFAKVSTAYLRYGAYPKTSASIVLVISSSIAILLACVPLYNALRSNGPKWLAEILLAPLALFSLAHLVQIARYCIGFPGMPTTEVFYYEVYFRPELLAKNVARLRTGLNLSFEEFVALVVETAKYCIIFTIAIWLTIAQITAWRQRRKTRAGL